MVVQWLRLHTSSVGGMGLIPGQEISPHSATKSLHAATKDPMCHN